AGIGNIFLADDAFGVEVARRLSERALPDEVRVVDFGIRGVDLAFALLEPYDCVILVDAMPRGGAPGTLYVLEPDVDAGEAMVAMHNRDPVKVIRTALSMGATLRRVVVIGCEPTPLDESVDIAVGLSPAVQASVEEAVNVTIRAALESLAASAHVEPVAH